jgi:large subunit ribosomal protein L21e
VQVVRNRIEKKRINLKIEHVRASKCRKDFLKRVAQNDEVKRNAKKAGKRVPIEAIKRFPVGPKAAFVVSPSSGADNQPILLAPTLFDDML